jgi:cyclopropane fatty-acyl-phospholipid synthase-like methyltransferase
MYIIEFIPSIIVILLLLIFIITFGIPVITGAQFAATSPSKVRKIAAKVKKFAGKKIVDLGSGDGCIVLSLAEAGLEAHGYEINPFLIWYSRKKIKQKGLEKLAYIHRKNYWQENLSDYDVVIIFGVPRRMKMFEKKLQDELKPGALVISNYFQFPNWKCFESNDGIYLYRK